MGDFWLPEAASTVAPEIDGLFHFVTIASAIVFGAVVVAMLYFSYRYRRQNPAERPTPVEESRLLEISWIVVPTIIVLLIFNWGFKSFVKLGTAPPDAYEVRVEANQWNWLFEYPNGVTSDTMYVPVGQPVKTTMSSRDVLHSFYVPEFRVKYDILPNRYTSVWFEATEEGTYDLFCAEYCGTDHSEMVAVVKAVSRPEFNEWLEDAGIPEDMPLPEVGERLYNQRGCQGCHTLDGTQRVGPTFEGLYGTTGHEMSDGSTVTVDENYLRESILEPGARIVEGFPNQMPPFPNLSEREVTALIEFIKEQSDQEPPAE